MINHHWIIGQTKEALRQSREIVTEREENPEKPTDIDKCSRKGTLQSREGE